MKSKNKNPSPAARPRKEAKLSRTHLPADISPLEWQRALRRQFRRKITFGETFFPSFIYITMAGKACISALAGLAHTLRGTAP